MKTLALLAALVALPAAGFPELIRHNYVNCTTCHVSPSGGGVLTQYGRGLSKEILSTWGREGEEAFLYGAIKPPDWLSLGGDIRALQMYLNTPRVEQAKLIVMQADVEAAATVGKFTAVATLGYQSEDSFNHVGGPIFSRRHYVNYRPTDTLSFRAGRFMAAYGINLADHQVMTKRGLRWDEGSETYNVEAAWLGERFDAFATVIFGRPEASRLDFEKGLAVRASVNVSDSYKLGVSYFYGNNRAGSRHVTGPYGILGIAPHFFILAELDFQNVIRGGVGTWGFVNYLRVDYEILQGLHVYLTQELGKADWRDPASTTEAYGIGAQFFPRPHLEIQAVYQKRRVHASSSSFFDFAWLLAHYYL